MEHQHERVVVAHSVRPAAVIVGLEDPAQMKETIDARRGTYRVLYRIHEVRREAMVLRIDHRRDVYRPLP